MFVVWSLSDYVNGIPFDKIKTECTPGVFPAWYSDELAFMFLSRVFTDDAYCKYKGTLQKAWKNIRNMFRGGGVSSPVSVALQYKRRLLSDTLMYIGNFSQSVEARDGFMMDARFKVPDLIETLPTYLEHVIIRSKMEYDDKRWISQRILGHPLNSSTSLSQSVDRYAKNLIRTILRRNLPPSVDAKFIKKFTKTVVPNVARMYDLPEELLNSLISNQGSCPYLRGLI